MDKRYMTDKEWIENYGKENFVWAEGIWGYTEKFY